MKRIKWHLPAALILVVVLTAGCAYYKPWPSIAVAEQNMMTGCTFLQTLTEISDMGKVQRHPNYTYDAQEQVIHRAAKLGATHIVWLYNYPQGSAARAYQCPQ